MSRPVTLEELQALRRMPVYFDDGGLLPDGSPPAAVMDRLLGKALIVPLPHTEPDRFALSYRGQRLLWPEPFQRFDEDHVERAGS